VKFFLISDNHDTLLGMRMAGVEGVLAHEAAEVELALENARKDRDVGIVLVTAKLMELCRQRIYEYKLHGSLPLIVEVADRHGKGKVTDSIGRYVMEAVGIKLDMNHE
jgi:V/A-type H+-transporting ATPase subunit F